MRTYYGGVFYSKNSSSKFVAVVVIEEDYAEIENDTAVF